MIKSPICFDKQITEWDSSCDVDEAGPIQERQSAAAVRNNNRFGVLFRHHLAHPGHDLYTH